MVQNESPKNSLRRVMVMTLAVPALLALVFGVSLIGTRWGAMADARHVARLMGVAQTASALAHAQQLERDMTSLFLSGTTKAPPDRLQEQRRTTDGTKAALLAQAERIGLANLPVEIADLIEELRGDFERAAKIRADADTRSGATTEVLDYFTEMNADVLQLVGLVASASANPQINSRIAAYSAFQTAKEYAALERGLGAAGFHQGQFDTATLLTMRTMVSRQDQALEFFRIFAAPADLAAVEALSREPAAAELARMREVAFGFPDSRDLGPLTGDAFFDTATARISAMKRVEDQIGIGIVAQAETIEGSALWGFLSVAGLVVGALVLSILLAARAVRSTEGDVGRFVLTAVAMSEGRLDADLPKTQLRETAQMALALDRFRTSILHSQTAAQSAEAERAAQRAELDRREALDRAAQTERLEQAALEARRLAERDGQIAAEISAVVAACAQGDFSHRIDLAQKTGIFAEICQGMNRIGETVDGGTSAVNAALRALAEGDLSYRIGDGFVGVFADMAASVRAASDSIARTVRTIDAAATTIDTSSREISTAADDLARRSEQNAAMLEETATALEQMSGSIGSMARVTGEAKERMRDISSRAETGNGVAAQAIAAMESIRLSSERIERVLQVIDDIAFQTNLLALNAGVEAARAGESGRGFAVVASEVRALAQRSSEASHEIAQIIQTATQDVGRGVDRVQETGGALEQIVAGLRESMDRIEHIVSAVGETEIGIAEITRATSELDRATQQNAAMFEQTNAALGSLRVESDLLIRNVAQFRTGPTEAAAQARVA